MNILLEPLKSTNADFDGDVLNTLGLELPELWDMFGNFSPSRMLINRSTNGIKYDISALENVSIAILSDK